MVWLQRCGGMRYFKVWLQKCGGMRYFKMRLQRCGGMRYFKVWLQKCGGKRYFKVRLQRCGGMRYCYGEVAEVLRDEVMLLCGCWCVEGLGIIMVQLWGARMD